MVEYSNTKYLLVGVVFGCAFILCLHRNIPEKFGFRTEKDVILMRQVAEQKYQQCEQHSNDEHAAREAYEKQMNTATKELGQLKNKFDKLQKEKDNLEIKIKESTIIIEKIKKHEPLLQEELVKLKNENAKLKKDSEVQKVFEEDVIKLKKQLKAIKESYSNGKLITTLKSKVETLENVENNLVNKKIK